MLFRFVGLYKTSLKIKEPNRDSAQPGVNMLAAAELHSPDIRETSYPTNTYPGNHQSKSGSFQKKPFLKPEQEKLTNGLAALQTFY